MATEAEIIPEPISLVKTEEENQHLTLESDKVVKLISGDLKKFQGAETDECLAKALQVAGKETMNIVSEGNPDISKGESFLISPEISKVADETFGMPEHTEVDVTPFKAEKIPEDEEKMANDKKCLLEEEAGTGENEAKKATEDNRMEKGDTDHGIEELNLDIGGEKRVEVEATADQDSLLEEKCESVEEETSHSQESEHERTKMDENADNIESDKQVLGIQEADSELKKQALIDTPDPTIDKLKEPNETVNAASNSKLVGEGAEKKSFEEVKDTEPEKLPALVGKEEGTEATEPIEISGSEKDQLISDSIGDTLTSTVAESSETKDRETTSEISEVAKKELHNPYEEVACVNEPAPEVDEKLEQVSSIIIKDKSQATIESREEIKDVTGENDGIPDKNVLDDASVRKTEELCLQEVDDRDMCNIASDIKTENTIEESPAEESRQREISEKTEQDLGTPSDISNDHANFESEKDGVEEKVIRATDKELAMTEASDEMKRDDKAAVPTPEGNISGVEYIDIVQQSQEGKSEKNKSFQQQNEPEKEKPDCPLNAVYDDANAAISSENAETSTSIREVTYVKDHEERFEGEGMEDTLTNTDAVSKDAELKEKDLQIEVNEKTETVKAEISNKNADELQVDDSLVGQSGAKEKEKQYEFIDFEREEQVNEANGASKGKEEKSEDVSDALQTRYSTNSEHILTEAAATTDLKSETSETDKENVKEFHLLDSEKSSENNEALENKQEGIEKELEACTAEKPELEDAMENIEDNSKQEETKEVCKGPKSIPKEECAIIEKSMESTEEMHERFQEDEKEETPEVKVGEKLELNKVEGAEKQTLEEEDTNKDQTTLLKVTMEEKSKEENNGEIMSKKEASNSNIEETDSTEETALQNLEKTAEPNNDPSLLDIEKESREEITAIKSKEDLVHSSSIELKESKKEVEEENSVKGSIKIADLDTASPTSETEETNIREAGPEEKNKEINNVLAVEEKGLATTELQGIGIDSADIDVKPAESSTSFDKEKEIPQEEDRMQDKVPNAGSEDQMEMTTREISIKEILEEVKEYSTMPSEEYEYTPIEERKIIDETSEKDQAPDENSETPVSQATDEILMLKDNNPTLDVPKAESKDTEKESGHEVKEHMAEEPYVHTEQESGKCSYVSEVTNISNGEEPRENESDACKAETQQDKQKSDIGSEREKVEEGKPLEEASDVGETSGTCNDSEKAIQEEKNLAKNLAIPESLKEDTEVEKETALPRGAHDQSPENVELALEGFEEKPKSGSEPVVEDQSEEASPEPSKSQADETSTGVQNEETEKQITEELENKLDNEDYVTKEKNANEVTKAVILSEEVDKEVEKADVSEDIKEHVIEEESSTNELHPESKGDETTNEVDDDTSVSTECLKEADSNKQTEARKSEVEERLTKQEREASLVIKESEESQQDEESGNPVNVQGKDEESEEKIEDIVDESKLCQDKSDSEIVTKVRAETSINNAEVDEKLVNTSNISAETTESDANQGTNELQLEEISSELAPPVPIKKSDEVEKQSLNVEIADHDEVEVVKRDPDAVCLTKDQTDEAEKSLTVEKLDQLPNKERELEETKSEATKTSNADELAKIELASDGDHVSEDKGTEDDAEIKKILTVEELEANEVDETKGVPEEKPEEQLQTSASTLPSEDKEIRTPNLIEKIDEIEKDGRIIEHESLRDSSDTNTKEEVCLQKEEHVEMKADLEEETIADRGLQKEEPQKQIQTTSSTFPSEKTEYEAGAISEEIDVTGDGITGDQTHSANKPEEGTTSFAVLSKEQEEEVEKIDEEKKINEAEIQEDKISEDPSAVKKTEETYLEKKEFQELEDAQKDETAAAQAIQVEEPKDQSLTSPLPSQKIEHEAAVNEEEEEKIREVEMLERELFLEKERPQESEAVLNQETTVAQAIITNESVGIETIGTVEKLDEEKRKDTDNLEDEICEDSSARETEDICLQKEELNELHAVPEEGITSGQTFSEEQSDEQLHISTSAINSEELEHETKKTEDEDANKEETIKVEIPEDASDARTVDAICSQKDRSIELEAVVEAGEENQLEKTDEGNEIILNEVSKEEVIEDEKVTEISYSTSYSENQTKDCSREDELKDKIEDKINEVLETACQNKELLVEAQKSSENDNIEKQIVCEEKTVEDPGQASDEVKEYSTMPPEENELTPIEEKKITDESSEEDQAPDEHSQTPVSQTTDGMLMQKEGNPTLDVPKAESEDTGKESEREVKENLAQEPYVHIEQESGKCSSVSDVTNVLNCEKPRELENESDAYKTKTLQDEQSSDIGLERERIEDGKPLDEASDVGETSRTCNDSEKAFQEEDNLDKNFAKPESLKEDTEVEKEETELPRGAHDQTPEVINVNDNAKDVELPPAGFEEKPKSDSEPVVEDQSKETFPEPSKSLDDETSTDVQNKETEKKITEEPEDKLDNEDHVDREQNANEVTKAVILSDEMDKEVEKADDSEGIKEHAIEEESSTNKLHPESKGDETTNEVENYTSVSTECLKEADLDKPIEVRKSEAEGHSTKDREASLVIKESEERREDEESADPVNMQREVKESEEKIEDIVDESKLCQDKTDIEAVTKVRAETSLNNTEVDEELVTTSNISSENTESDANQGTKEQQLEEISRDLAPPGPTNDNDEVEKQCLNVEIADHDEAEVIKRDPDAVYLSEDQIDEAEKSITVEKVDHLPNDDHELAETKSEASKTSNADALGKLELASDGDHVSEEKGIEQDAETKKSLTAEELEANAVEETKGVAETSSDYSSRSVEIIVEGDISCHNTLLEEKPEDQLQTSASALPSEDKEIRTPNSVEKIEEIKEDAATVKHESPEDSSHPETKEEVCLQKEEQREPKAVSEEETVVDQALQKEEPRKQTQTTSLSEKREDAAGAISEEIDATGDGITGEQTLSANKPEEGTTSILLLSKEQEEETIGTVEKTDEEKIKDKEIPEDKTSEDSSDAKKAAEISLEKEEFQELEDAKKDVSVDAQAIQVEEPKEQSLTSALPSENIEHGVTANEEEEEEEENVKEVLEKERAQEPEVVVHQETNISYASITNEFVEVESVGSFEKLDEEKRKDAENPEDEICEDSSARETKDICLQKEEPNELQAVPKEGITSDQTFSEEQSDEKLHISTSATTSVELEHETKKTEDEETNKAETIKDEISEYASDARTMEEICSQKDRSIELEAEQKIQNPTCTRPSEEVEGGNTSTTEKIESEKIEKAKFLHDDNREDVTLQKEQRQENEALAKDENASSQTLPTEKSEEQIPNPVATLISEERKHETVNEVDKAEEERVKEEEMRNEDPDGGKTVEEICCEKDDKRGSQAVLEETTAIQVVAKESEEKKIEEAEAVEDDKSPQSECVRELQDALEDGPNTAETLSGENQPDQLHVTTSTLPSVEQENETKETQLQEDESPEKIPEQTREIEEASNVKMETCEKASDNESLTESNDTEIKEKLVKARDETAGEENQCEKINEGNEIILSEVSKKEIIEDEQVTETTYSSSHIEEQTKDDSEEDELKDKLIESKTNEALETTYQNEEILLEAQKSSENVIIEKRIVCEDKIIEDEGLAEDENASSQTLPTEKSEEQIPNAVAALTSEEHKHETVNEVDKTEEEKIKEEEMQIEDSDGGKTVAEVCSEKEETRGPQAVLEGETIASQQIAQESEENKIEEGQEAKTQEDDKSLQPECARELQAALEDGANATQTLSGENKPDQLHITTSTLASVKQADETKEIQLPEDENPEKIPEQTREIEEASNVITETREKAFDNELLTESEDAAIKEKLVKARDETAGEENQCEKTNEGYEIILNEVSKEEAIEDQEDTEKAYSASHSENQTKDCSGEYELKDKEVLVEAQKSTENNNIERQIVCEDKTIEDHGQASVASIDTAKVPEEESSIELSQAEGNQIIDDILKPEERTNIESDKQIPREVYLIENIEKTSSIGKEHAPIDLHDRVAESSQKAEVGDVKEIYPKEAEDDHDHGKEKIKDYSGEDITRESTTTVDNSTKVSSSVHTESSTKETLQVTQDMIEEREAKDETGTAQILIVETPEKQSSAPSCKLPYEEGEHGVSTQVNAVEEKELEEVEILDKHSSDAETGEAICLEKEENKELKAAVEQEIFAIQAPPTEVCKESETAASGTRKENPKMVEHPIAVISYSSISDETVTESIKEDESSPTKLTEEASNSNTEETDSTKETTVRNLEETVEPNNDPSLFDIEKESKEEITAIEAKEDLVHSSSFELEESKKDIEEETSVKGSISAADLDSASPAAETEETNTREAEAEEKKKEIPIEETKITDEMLMQKEDNPTLDVPKAESEDTRQETEHEVKEHLDEELYVHTEQESGKCSSVSEVTKEPRELENESDACNAKTLQDEQSSDIGLEREKVEEGKPLDEASDVGKTWGTCNDSEKAIQEEENLARNLAKPESLKEDTEVEKEEIELHSGAQDQISESVEQALEGFEEKPKSDSEPVVEDQSKETFPEPSKRQADETSTDVQNQETEKQISEELEEKLDNEEHVDREQKANEVAGPVILSEEVDKEVEKANDSEDIKEHIEEENNRNELHPELKGDETTSQVENYTSVSTECLKEADFDKQIEARKSEVEEHSTKDREAFLVIKESEERRQDEEFADPASVQDKDEESEEKIEDIADESKLRQDKSDIEAVTEVRAETSLNKAEMDDELVHTSNISSETTESNANQEIKELQLEEISSDLAPPVPTNNNEAVEKHGLNVEIVDQDETELVKRDTDAVYLSKDQIDEAEKSQTVEKVDQLTNNDQWTTKLASDGDPVSDDKGGEQDAEPKKSLTAEELEANEVEETKGETEKSSDYLPQTVKTTVEDDISSHNTFPVEQLQTSASTLPSEDKEIKTPNSVEKIEEIEKDAAIIEHESLEDSSDTKTKDEVCLQKEENTEPKADLEEETVVDQGLQKEEPKKQIQTTSSTFPSEKMEDAAGVISEEIDVVTGDGVTGEQNLSANQPEGTTSFAWLSKEHEEETTSTDTVEKIDEEKIKEAEIPEDKISEDYSDAKKTAEICLEKEELQKLEDAKKAETAVARAIQEEEKKEQSLTSALPSEDIEHEKTAEICLEKEEHQKLEDAKKDETAIAQAIQVGEPKEQSLTSALPSEDREHEKTAEIRLEKEELQKLEDAKKDETAVAQAIKEEELKEQSLTSALTSEDIEHEATVNEEEEEAKETKAEMPEKEICIEKERPQESEVVVDQETTVSQVSIKKESVEIETIGTVEKLKEEKRKDAENHEDEICEDSSARETDGICLKKEEPNELQAVPKEGITSSQTVSEEQSDEQLHISTSAITSEELEHETKKTEDEETNKEETIKDDTPEGASDARTMEEICSQKDRSIQLEAAVEDEMTAGHTLTEEKSEEQVQNPTSSLPSKEEEGGNTSTTEKIEEAEFLEDDKGEDVSSQKGLQDDEAPEKDENASCPTLPTEKSEEQIPNPVATLTSEEHKQETVNEVDKAEGEKIKEEEVTNEDSDGRKTVVEIFCEKDETRGPQAVLEGETIASQVTAQESEEKKIEEAEALGDDKSPQSEFVRDLQGALEDGAGAAQTLSGDNRPDQFHTTTSTLPPVEQEDETKQTELQEDESAEKIPGQTREIKEASNVKMETREKAFDNESLTESEDAAIKEKLVKARDETVGEENQCEKINEGNEIILSEVSKEEIIEDEQVTETTYSTSHIEEQTKDDSGEGELKDELIESKTNEALDTTCQNEEFPVETQRSTESDDIEDQIFCEDKTVEDPGQASVTRIETATVTEEESSIELSQAEDTTELAEGNQIIDDIQQPGEMTNKASDKQIPRELDPIEYTEITSSIGKEQAPIALQDKLAESSQKVEVGDVKEMYPKEAEANHGREKITDDSGEGLTKESMSVDESPKVSSSAHIESFKRETLLVTQELIEQKEAKDETGIALVENPEEQSSAPPSKMTSDEGDHGISTQVNAVGEMELKEVKIQDRDSSDAKTGVEICLEKEENKELKAAVEQETIAVQAPAAEVKEDPVSGFEDSHKEDELKDEHTTEKTNETLKVPTHEIQNEELCVETLKDGANNNIKKEIVTEDETVKDLKQAPVGMKEATIGSEEIPGEADPIESRKTTSSIGKEHFATEQQDRALETSDKAEVGDLEPVNAQKICPEAVVDHGEEQKTETLGVEITQETASADSAELSLSDLLQRFKREKLQASEHVTEERELTASKEEPNVEEAETIQVNEAKTDEEKDGEEGDDHNRTDSGSDAPVMVEAPRDAMVEAPRDADTKTHKKSHNILSGVGLKVKHSISKVKKAITGKSSHSKESKQTSPKGSEK